MKVLANEYWATSALNPLVHRKVFLEIKLLNLLNLFLALTSSQFLINDRVLINFSLIFSNLKQIFFSVNSDKINLLFFNLG